MKPELAKLKERLLCFSLDDPNAAFSFSKRLARENGWSMEYAQRVIVEYKKFAFLAVAAGHPVTPSDQVDQVWHLHLLYTHSYWEEFCPKILLSPLHHGPTLGGKSENDKFNDWYSQTLASYTAIFEETPPSDIWPPPHIRFGRDIHFKRVNTQENWIVPKFHLNPKTKIFLLSPSAIAFILCMPFSPTAIGKLFGFGYANFPGIYLCLTILALPFAYELGRQIRRFFSEGLPNKNDI
ncbi:hypothetical protein NUACC21_24450 [Scytonema sp. NUACC21]